MMNKMLSDVSIGVIYDLEGDRSGDVVYLQWTEDSKKVRGELFGVKETPKVRDYLAAGLPDDDLELLVCNVYKIKKLLDGQK